MAKDSKRLLSRAEVADQVYTQMISELEYVAQAIVYVENGMEAAKWIHRRINKLLEEKAKCRLK